MQQHAIQYTHIIYGGLHTLIHISWRCTANANATSIMLVKLSELVLFYNYHNYYN